MQNKAILFSILLVASSSVLAEQGLLEGVAKQAVQDKATSVLPNAAPALDQANTLKSAPDALQDQAKETVKSKVTDAVPEEAKKSVETVKAGKEKAEGLKEKVSSAPKSTKALKNKAKEKVIEKALNPLH